MKQPINGSTKTSQPNNQPNNQSINKCSPLAQSNTLSIKQQFNTSFNRSISHPVREINEWENDQAIKSTGKITQPINPPIQNTYIDQTIKQINVPTNQINQINKPAKRINKPFVQTYVFKQSTIQSITQYINQALQSFNQSTKQ